MRYFYVTYKYKNGQEGHFTVAFENYPSLSGLKGHVITKFGGVSLKEAHITNIIEFKNEQDYNDFVK